MHKEWADQNKLAQQKLKKATFAEGIEAFITLREMLMQEMLSWKSYLKPEDYHAIPFLHADGYHSKTVAYSIWHIMRIEDIVVNTLIQKKDEVFFAQGYDQSIGTSCITTGNEYQGMEIAHFSEELNLEKLYQYTEAVKSSTDAWLRSISYEDLKIKFGEEDGARIQERNVVSKDPEAIWLIDYWCNKDVAGLIKMPLSRHWIMHIEAADRIINKIKN